MKYYFVLVGLCIFSCKPSEPSLQEQFFTPEEIILLDGFLDYVDGKVCANTFDQKFLCYNAHFGEAMKRIYSSKEVNYDLNALDFIKKLDRQTFDLLFFYTDGQHMIDMWSPWIDKQFLNILDDGKFVNFADEYCKLSDNESLKEIWKLSYKFSRPGPMTTGFLYKNADVIDYSNDIDRLIFSILYVILDYNISFES